MSVSVGDLARPQPQPAAADHVADWAAVPVDDLLGRTELERPAERIANGQAEQTPTRAISD